MGLLNKTKTYLVGPMQMMSDSGMSWREKAESFLSELGITVFNPCRKPFIKDLDEVQNKDKMLAWLRNGCYSDVHKAMKEIRAYDLALCDKSDFIVSHINPLVCSYGTAEELVTSVRMKKPIFLSVEGGKAKTPLWIFGMTKPEYIFDSIDESLEMIRKIDSGLKPIDSDRWRLLREEIR